MEIEGLQKNGLSLTRGYQKGMEQFLAMVALQVKYGIKETSFWALSTDNYQKRSTDEKQTIFSLMKSFLELKANEQFFKENGIFVRLVGDIEGMQKQEKKFFGKLFIFNRDGFTNEKVEFSPWRDSFYS